MIIGVDIDGCVVNTGDHWLSYLQGRYEQISHQPYKVPYDCSELFAIPYDCDPYSFWRDPHLYEGLRPIEGSVGELGRLKGSGHEIVFISQAKGFHHKSKYQFIDRWFPFRDAVILTKEKHYVNVDIMIDDKYDVLDAFSEDVITVKFQDRYLQAPPKRSHIEVDSWETIRKKFREW